MNEQNKELIALANQAFAPLDIGDALNPEGILFKCIEAFAALLQASDKADAVGKVIITPFGEKDITAIQWIGDYKPKLGDELYTSSQALKSPEDELTEFQKEYKTPTYLYFDRGHNRYFIKADHKFNEAIDRCRVVNSQWGAWQARAKLGQDQSAKLAGDNHE